jgi:hypothetical protein
VLGQLGVADDEEVLVVAGPVQLKLPPVGVVGIRDSLS